jgi:AcrR family transcriptional regulator
MKHSEPRANRKEVILNTAIVCFTEYGYYKASMDMISEKAEITKRGLYYHFRSKDELFIAIFKYRGEKYFKQLALKSSAGSTSPGQSLIMFIKRESKALIKDDIFLRFMVEFVSISARNPKVKEVIKEYYKNSIHCIQIFLEEGIKAGDFIKHDTEKVARTLYFVGLGKFFAKCSFGPDFELFGQQIFDVKQILLGINSCTNISPK